jgi:hypothetical protein
MPIYEITLAGNSFYINLSNINYFYLQDTAKGDRYYLNIYLVGEECPLAITFHDKSKAEAATRSLFETCKKIK